MEENVVEFSAASYIWILISSVPQFDVKFGMMFKGALSRTFFGFFSKTAPKLRLSTFNHAGSTPRT